MGVDYNARLIICCVDGIVATVFAIQSRYFSFLIYRTSSTIMLEILFVNENLVVAAYKHEPFT
jgi:hypothetical protein